MTLSVLWKDEVEREIFTRNARKAEDEGPAHLFNRRLTHTSFSRLTFKLPECLSPAVFD